MTPGESNRFTRGDLILALVLVASAFVGRGAHWIMM